MTLEDSKILRGAGFALETVNTLATLRYSLASYDDVTGEAHLAVPPDGDPSRPPHGFTLHRQDAPWLIGQTIFECGVLNHQKQTRDAFQSLLTAAGLQHR